ncbi:hypothetical protein [Mongoliimonas terrestris]|uniref:hypothetical protein n=1 Tax=Mongoliimonas terrestris TaxID=1709001 RepID=UPI0009497BAD|nr:hypothetical protein [Mongoliimonas terrestris]
MNLAIDLEEARKRALIARKMLIRPSRLPEDFNTDAVLRGMEVLETLEQEHPPVPPRPLPTPGASFEERLPELFGSGVTDFQKLERLVGEAFSEAWPQSLLVRDFMRHVDERQPARRPKRGRRREEIANAEPADED